LRAISIELQVVRKTYHFGHPLTDTDRFITGVLAALRQTPFDLVIPTSDKSLVPLAPLDG